MILSHICVLAQNPLAGERLHWNSERGYAPFQFATDEAVCIDNTSSLPLTDNLRLPDSPASFSLRFTVSNAHNHPAKSYTITSVDGAARKVKNPAWGFFINNGRDSLIVTVKTIELQDALSSEAAVSVSMRQPNSKEESVILKDGIDFHTGKNTWQLTVKDGIATLSCGNRKMQQAMSFPYSHGNADGFGFIAYPGAAINVTDITFSDNSPENNLVLTQWSNPNHLRNYLAASKDSMEGYWTAFDRTLEETLLQLGGEYQFAMVKDGEGYMLIYLGGARVNAAVWKPGMVKAYLEPDFFPGIYNVVWIDAEGQLLSNAIKAQSGDGDTLTIQFPYQSSSLRLRKIPQ